MIWANVPRDGPPASEERHHTRVLGHDIMLVTKGWLGMEIGLGGHKMSMSREFNRW